MSAVLAEMAARMRVLVVLPNVPYPLLSGGHLRDWQVLNVLSRLGIRPHILFFGTAETGRARVEPPVENLVASGEFAGWRNETPDLWLGALARRKLSYVFSRFPRTHPFSYQYDAAQAGAKIVAHAKRVRADAVIIRSFWCRYVPQLKTAGFRVIANCPDHNTALAWEMVRATRSPLRKIGPFCNYVGVRRLERCFLPFCDELWVPTDEEARALRRAMLDVPVIVFPNLLDVRSMPDLTTGPAPSKSLLFVGNFGYLPNANAAETLLDQVFPAVRRSCPGAQLRLVGRAMPDRLQEKGATSPGVRVEGFVHDLIECYRSSAVVLLPVREGGGMLFKALEALSLGKATVGFRGAFRGIETNGEEPFVVVSSTREMASAASRLLNDQQLAGALAKRARLLAERSWSWDRGAEILRLGSLLARDRETFALPRGSQ